MHQAIHRSKPSIWKSHKTAQNLLLDLIIYRYYYYIISYFIYINHACACFRHRLRSSSCSNVLRCVNFCHWATANAENSEKNTCAWEMYENIKQFIWWKLNLKTASKCGRFQGTHIKMQWETHRKTGRYRIFLLIHQYAYGLSMEKIKQNAQCSFFWAGKKTCQNTGGSSGNDRISWKIAESIVINRHVETYAHCVDMTLSTYVSCSSLL